MRAFLICLVVLFAAPVWAQEAEAPAPEAGEVAPAAALEAVFPDQAEWESFAERAQEAVAAGRASNAALSDLRAELVDWRDTFLSRQSANAGRIATVRAQIAALGAAPEAGEEDPRVAARRSELQDQLQQLRAPVVLAQEARTLAGGLIGEVDALIRDRQTDEFTERSQSPLNPTGWARAMESVTGAYRSMRAEVARSVSNPSRQAELVDQLLAILGLLAVALVFVARGGVWVERFAARMAAGSLRGQGVWSFVLSLGQVAVPMIGLICLSSALQMTGMLGRRLGIVVDALPMLGLVPILAHWLAGQLLPKDKTTEDHPLMLEAEVSARANRWFVIMGYGIFAFMLANVFAQANTFGDDVRAVMVFPLGVVMAWTMYWLGHALRKSAVTPDEEGPRSFRMALRGIASRGVMIAAAAGVALAALGYANGLELITLPAAMTLFVLGILLLLQRLSVDAYSLLAKGESSAQDALMPVLIGFALVVLAVPILAVIWGAQVTDITEVWARFREGFSIGETRISPTSFLLFALVFVAGYTITRLIQGALRSTVLPRTKLDPGGQNAIVSGMGYVGIFLAAVVAITTAGIDLSGLAIVAGALSVGIGFGLQNIVSNFVAGIILLIERPISKGDWIEVGGQMGYVRDISVRSTRIETFDRTDVIVPNADLVSGQVTNWTRGNNVGRVIVPVGVAYGTDTDRVAKILQEIAEAHPMVLLNPGPSVVFQGFGADSLDFEIRAILRDVNYVLSVKSEMNHQIAKRFVEEEIEIPFGQRDIWLRNPETLAKSLAKAAPKPKDTST